MFEAAEAGHAVDKETYQREVPALREALLATQYELLKDARFPVIVLINGVDAAGRGETMNLLKEWMDPRHIQVYALTEPSDEERERPWRWRFWRALPPRGRIGIFFGSWYTHPLLARVFRESDVAVLDQAMEENVRFERMLANEGALILKFWFHLSKEKQKKRLKSLEKDPKTRWRVTARDWRHYKLYDRFHETAERALRLTSTEFAPWTVVDGSDPYYRALVVGRQLLEAMQARLAQKNASPACVTVPPRPAPDLELLRKLDLSLALPKDKYHKQLEKQQGRLNGLVRHKRFKDLSVVAVFEGMDAAGKGSAIRRVTGALDARQYQVFPIAAPSDEARAQPYLWRFWRRLPRRNHIAIFDRSWYGRVLVERVEGFCPEPDWLRAYSEINDFEEQLVNHGIVLVKFWLQISLDEQLRRFKERENISFKRFKITEEDWRNREKWDAYEQAVCDMITRTSTEIAPWTLVEANDKRFARVKILETLGDRIKKAL